MEPYSDRNILKKSTRTSNRCNIINHKSHTVSRVGFFRIYSLFNYLFDLYTFVGNYKRLNCFQNVHLDPCYQHTKY